MAIIMKLMMLKKQKDLSLSASMSPPRYAKLSVNDDYKARKGYVPVMLVEEKEGLSERFVIPTHLMSHPSIIALLELSADEFGFGQQRVLRIPLDPDHFREILNRLIN